MNHTLTDGVSGVSRFEQRGGLRGFAPKHGPAKARPKVVIAALYRDAKRRGRRVR